VANQRSSIEKGQFRRKFRQLLRDLPPDQIPARSAEIVAGLAEWLAGAKHLKRIAIFSALPGEPQLAELQAYRAGPDFLYPLVRDDQSLSFHEVRDPGTLRVGHRDIREPDPNQHPRVPTELIDAFLCPGLGFGLDGTRLGRGGGYYDRALAAGRAEAIRIGVCFRDQVVPVLPREAHDAIMTHLADESGLLELTPTPEAPS
jgi:5-formyltetrahydrofolate cyclo-ligase